MESTKINHIHIALRNKSKYTEYRVFNVLYYYVRFSQRTSGNSQRTHDIRTQTSKAF